uniref:transposase n=1 Tax=Paenibacillus allorhizosphaerae TaxID=2849866 RepID=UPI0038B23FDF
MRSGSTKPGQRRKFTTEFKKQMVQLYENGKSRASIVEEYDLTSSALDRWIHMRFRDTNI